MGTTFCRTSTCIVGEIGLPSDSAMLPYLEKRMNVPTAIDLDQFRTDFIKTFDRIGMNTTPGDAQFLRILMRVRRRRTAWKSVRRPAMGPS